MLTQAQTPIPKQMVMLINLDGKLNILDVVLTRAHIIGSRNLSLIDDMATTRADMNIDDSVDIIDIVMMRKYIINKG